MHKELQVRQSPCRSVMPRRASTRCIAATFRSTCATIPKTRYRLKADEVRFQTARM